MNKLLMVLFLSISLSVFCVEHKNNKGSATSTAHVTGSSASNMMLASLVFPVSLSRHAAVPVSDSQHTPTVQEDEAFSERHANLLSYLTGRLADSEGGYVGRILRMRQVFREADCYAQQCADAPLFTRAADFRAQYARIAVEAERTMHALVTEARLGAHE